MVRTQGLGSFLALYAKFKRKGLSPVTSWLVRTAYELQQEGLKPNFTDRVPAAGILFGTSQTTSYLLRPPSELLYVHIITDGCALHPYAQVNISQNLAQFGDSRRCRYMPHWPQAGILPRNPERANLVTNIAYMGDPENLAKELQHPEWRARLQRAGFRWAVKPPEAWHDYSDVDAVVAVRTFEDGDVFHYKPASKLYNAWIAGVPAMLGKESAYRAEKHASLDFIEVNSADAIVENLNLLRSDAALYERMRARAAERGAAMSSPAIRSKWLTLIRDHLQPLYVEWVSKGTTRRYAYFTSRYLELRWNGIRERLNRMSRRWSW